ncbi:helix-turn-helix domain-containing protein [Desnuesiella massiliensis]|uniref:helix-turn-helix domain-containing protein n=1 Tax=Desnuesiella massiliensis TaxID=1650662 RepID=UPI0006E315C7|nr:helix-turn-helix domain-containing protein [Desnuesiella massiliensis]
MALNDRQMKVIELYAQGTPITGFAKICGVSRQTIYTDLDNKDVKTGVDKCLTEMKNQAEKKLTQSVDVLIDEIKKLALTSKSEKIRSENLQYLLNRIYGTPTSKIKDVTEDQREEDKFDLDESVLGFDNIIKLDKKAQ